jgi:hypothetical protein
MRALEEALAATTVKELKSNKAGCRKEGSQLYIILLFAYHANQSD